MTTRSRKKKEKSEDEEKTEDIGETNFVKSLKFRKNRGNRIQALLNGEGDYDNDAFWSNNKYFGSKILLGIHNLILYKNRLS